jgi:hydrogenase maturation protease
LQRDPIPGIDVAEIGTAILHGLHFVEQADRVLVIDAAHGGQPPGTIYLFDHLANAPVPTVASVHALGLREALRLLPPTMPRPAITVLGVEPARLDYGMELTAIVQTVLPRVVQLARATVLGWRAGFSPLQRSDAAERWSHPSGGAERTLRPRERRAPLPAIRRGLERSAATLTD